MKKILAMMLAVMLMAGLVACGGDEAAVATTAAPETTAAPVETTDAVEGTEAATESATEEATEAVEGTEEATEATEEAWTENTEGIDENPAAMTASVEIMANIWNKYAEDEKFFVMGGDMNNMVDGAPGKFDVADTDGLTYTLLVPADQIANLADAASMVHGMLANNFTCGVFELVEGADAAAFTEAMKAAVTGNQWMCGMPDELVLVTVDDNHVLMAFGIADAINPFKTHLAEAYPEVTIVTESLAG